MSQDHRGDMDIALDRISILYGHKEGDLTRFPEPTRVLKYPHRIDDDGSGSNRGGMWWEYSASNSGIGRTNASAYK